MSHDYSDSIHINHQITLSQTQEEHIQRDDFICISRARFDNLNPRIQELILAACKGNIDESDYLERMIDSI